MSNVIPLTDNKIKTSKSRLKEYKLADGDGLRLKIKPSGLKTWELRYNLGGKQSSVALGRYPEVSLKQAREKRLEMRSLIAQGIKPVSTPKTIQVVAEGVITFDDLLSRYNEHRSDLSAQYIMDNTNILKRDFKDLLKMPIDDIKPAHLVKCFTDMENRGIKTASKKAGSLVNRLFKFACTKLWTENNPMGAIDLTLLLKKHKPKNFAHITDPKVLKALLCAINNGVMDISTKTALQVMPYVFVRPANIRAMLWSEIDFKKKTWTIPADKIKTDIDHVVPLTDTVISLIKTMEDNRSVYVFPSPYSKVRGLSENTLNVTLKRLGFDGIMTSHGFRHTASTMLHETIHIHKIPSDVIEMQMIHTEKNSVKGVYNKALYMSERIRLMQWWSDHLDSLQRNCQESE